MANTLNLDLHGRYVVLKATAFDEPYSEKERIAKVVGGFGADPDTNLSFQGGSLYVEFQDGSTGAFRGMDVEKLADGEVDWLHT